MFKQGCNSNGEAIRDVYVEHDPVDLFCPPEEGMTRQEFRDQCDINVLLATYEKTGQLSWLNQREPLYLDVSEVPDLQGAVRVLDLAEEAFMRLPATVRREFDNSAIAFVDFAANPDNLPRMREWGLAAPEKPAGAFSAAEVPSAPSAPSAAPAGAVKPPSGGT